MSFGAYQWPFDHPEILIDNHPRSPLQMTNKHQHGCRKYVAIEFKMIFYFKRLVMKVCQQQFPAARDQFESDQVV